MQTNPAFYIKAILGAVSSFIAALVTALGDNTISTQEWLTAIGVAVGALIVVYTVPNRKEPEETPENAKMPQ